MSISKASYGISFHYFSPENGLSEKIPAALELLELSGALLDSQTGKNILRSRKFKKIYCRDLTMPGISRQITGQSPSMQREFKRHFVRQLTQAAESGAVGACTDFDLEGQFTGSGRQQLKELLKSAFNCCGNNHIDLIFPVRIPLLNNMTSTEKYYQFAAELMFPGVKFSIDVHPHELAGREFDIAKMLNWLRFDIGMLRFVYEPETGNRLVEKLVKPWVEYLEAKSPDANIFFVPICSQNESMENELIFLEQFISDLKNK